MTSALSSRVMEENVKTDDSLATHQSILEDPDPPGAFFKPIKIQEDTTENVAKTIPDNTNVRPGTFVQRTTTGTVPVSICSTSVMFFARILVLLEQQQQQQHFDDEDRQEGTISKQQHNY
jgi:hypothetical protein